MYGVQNWLASVPSGGQEMPFLIQSGSISVECTFCRKRFAQSLDHLVHERAVICPNCAGLEELGQEELNTIISAATAHIKAHQHTSKYFDRHDA